MASKLRPEGGARPWKPAADVELVHELDRYNVPLSGIIKQGGRKYLFACLFGEEDPDNLWAYAPVSDEEIARLTQAAGDALLDAVDATLANRSLVVGFADEWAMEAWHTIDAGEEGPLRIAKRFIQRWRKSLDQQRQQTDELEQKHELVSA